MTWPEPWSFPSNDTSPHCRCLRRRGGQRRLRGCLRGDAPRGQRHRPRRRHRTWAGVNNWEPVAGGTGLCAELYERMRQVPESTCLQKRKCSYHPNRPWGWYDRDLVRTDYRLSLSRRTGMPVTFEPGP